MGLSVTRPPKKILVISPLGHKKYIYVILSTEWNEKLINEKQNLFCTSAILAFEASMQSC